MAIVHAESPRHVIIYHPQVADLLMQASSMTGDVCRLVESFIRPLGILCTLIRNNGMIALTCSRCSAIMNTPGTSGCIVRITIGAHFVQHTVCRMCDLDDSIRWHLKRGMIGTFLFSTWRIDRSVYEYGFNVIFTRDSAPFIVCVSFITSRVDQTISIRHVESVCIVNEPSMTLFSNNWVHCKDLHVQKMLVNTAIGILMKERRGLLFLSSHYQYGSLTDMVVSPDLKV